MGFFRRSRPVEPRRGVRIDVGDLNDQIAAGERPSIPWDGRYLVTMVESDGQERSHLIWEQAATYHQVKALLQEFKQLYGKPENASTYRIDEISGVWMAWKKGQPIGVMTVFHPVVFEQMDNNPNNRGY